MCILDISPWVYRTGDTTTPAYLVVNINGTTGTGCLIEHLRDLNVLSMQLSCEMWAGDNYKCPGGIRNEAGIDTYTCLEAVHPHDLRADRSTAGSVGSHSTGQRKCTSFNEQKKAPRTTDTFIEVVITTTRTRYLHSSDSNNRNKAKMGDNVQISITSITNDNCFL